MPLHPIYCRLTGVTRLRRALFGCLVVQVQEVGGGWHDASDHELGAIGFEATSSKDRRSKANSNR